jgi:protein-tyrosine phosphatase
MTPIGSSMLGSVSTAGPSRPGQSGIDEGCCNLRDLGGHRTTTGARVRHGRLLRSDSLVAASPGDRARLTRLKLATVIDLRSVAEVELIGRYCDEAVAYHNLPLGSVDGVTEVRWDDAEEVAAHYLELVIAGRQSISAALAVLTDPSAYPAAIHCTLGKDRTGVVVALVLSLLSVADDDIVADYAASRIGAERLAARFRTQLADHPELLRSVLAALLACHPATMHCFLAKLRDQFGSIEGYVEELGLSSAIGYLRVALLDRSG